VSLFDDPLEPALPFVLPRTEAVQVRWQPALQGHRIRLPDGEIFYGEHFFDRKTSDRCVAYFQENDAFDWQSPRWRERLAAGLDGIEFRHIRWKQDHLRLYGRTIPLPRLTAWYGDEGCDYAYSGIRSQAQPWNPGLLYIKERLETAFDARFNSVLLNWYRDGADAMGWHSDDERELGRNPCIASVNFGETRDFLLRHKRDHALKLAIPLKHGSVLLMSGALQHHWQHAVPKRSRCDGSRFNLTFRFIHDTPSLAVAKCRSSATGTTTSVQTGPNQ
jgi:alkylated DNA repair dioxygenase AlkB